MNTAAERSRPWRSCCDDLSGLGQLCAAGAQAEQSSSSATGWKMLLSPAQAIGQSLVMLTLYDEGQAHTERVSSVLVGIGLFAMSGLSPDGAPGGASMRSACNV